MKLHCTWIWLQKLEISHQIHILHLNYLPKSIDSINSAFNIDQCTKLTSKIQTQQENTKEPDYPIEKQSDTFSVSTLYKLESHSWEDARGCFHIWEDQVNNPNHMVASRETINVRGVNLA